MCMHGSLYVGYMRVFIGVGLCVRQVYIKLFTSLHAFITKIVCIGMDFILVCTCISYMYFEHPIVYMRVIYMHVCYVYNRSLI